MRILVALVVVIWRWVLQMYDEDGGFLGVSRERMRGWDGYVGYCGIVLSRRYMLRQRIAGVVVEWST